MTAWYCSKTEPCFQIKRNRPRCLSELSIRLWHLQKEQCGKDGQHHNDRECPSQTRSTQHASFSNQRVMYSTTVTLFSQIDHYIQKPCAAAVVGTSRWDEKVYYSYITLAQMVFFFLLQMVITEYKCRSYKPGGKWLLYTFYHIQIYCGAPVDTNDNSNKNTSEDTLAHKHFFFKLHCR